MVWSLGHELVVKSIKGTSSVNLTNNHIYITDSGTNQDQNCTWGNDICYCECNYINDTCIDLALDLGQSKHDNNVDDVDDDDDDDDVSVACCRW